MNHISQRNQLELQLRKYVKFMKICPENGVIKLSNEISKIELRLNQIREYDLEKLNQTVIFTYETKQSKSNFKTV